MNKCLVIVSDMNYIQHAKYLFSSAKNVGKWNGDMCLVCNGVDDKTKREFMNKGIHILDLPKDINPFFAKLYLFDTYFKRWDKMCYFDVDFVFTGDINGIVSEGEFLVDVEPFNVHQYFDKDANPKLFNELKSEIDVDSFGFNSGCMVYDTEIITDTSVSELLAYMEKYKEINHHTGLDEGTDQPILNIMFHRQLKQINGVAFHLKRKQDTVAMHTCRWHAPWKDQRYIQQYNHYLSMF